MKSEIKLIVNWDISKTISGHEIYAPDSLLEYIVSVIESNANFDRVKLSFENSVIKNIENKSKRPLEREKKIKLSKNDIDILKLEKQILGIYANMKNIDNKESRSLLYDKANILLKKQANMIFDNDGEFRNDKLHLTVNGHLNIKLLESVIKSPKPINSKRS